MRIKSASFRILIVVVPAVVIFSAWAIYRLAPESTPVARGAAYAQLLGCIDCHGDPKQPLADSNDEHCADTNRRSWHPDYAVDCADVLAYFEAIRLFRNFESRTQLNSDNPLAAGERLAREYHCFQCHGHLGQGGFQNAKSLKGYVPGYFGKDFLILTRDADPDSVRQWIMHGIDPAVTDAPVVGWLAKLIIGRQAIAMPSFKSLEAAEIEILVRYVIALNQFGPMTAATVRSYGEQSQSAGATP